jgi:membrane dipeptidase
VTILWDQHACLPLTVDADFDLVQEHAAAGASFVSINVGYGAVGAAEVLPVLDAFRARVLAAPDTYVLAQTAADVDQAARSRRLAIGFDLEDTSPLDGDVGMVARYRALGVGAMLLTYNTRNLAGHGCHDDPEGGLTPFGRDVVREMNRVGMLVDVAHCSVRTALDAVDVSSAPVIVSHTACRALHDHERNVSDEQLRAVAAAGGVVGITGVGIFLGENDTRTETLARHVEHAVEVAGIDHVGLGSDYVFDRTDLERELAEHPELFPPSYSRWGAIDFVAPAQLRELGAVLARRGFGADDVAKVLGANFRRVAGDVWR